MELLKKRLTGLGFEVSEDQIEKFRIYMEGVLEYNQHINLTSITDHDEFIDKHFADSILGTDCEEFRPIFWFKQEDKMLYEKQYDIVHSKCYSEYGMKNRFKPLIPFYVLQVFKRTSSFSLKRQKQELMLNTKDRCSFSAVKSKEQTAVFHF